METSKAERRAARRTRQASPRPDAEAARIRPSPVTGTEPPAERRPARSASQLALPFVEAPGEDEPVEQEPSVPEPGLDLSAPPPVTASGASPEGPPAERNLDECSLESIRRYLKRHFEDFVLQQRHQAIGVHLTLYRVPDGTLYRVNVAARFLEEPRPAEDIERFLDEHDLRGKMPSSVLSAILIDVDGIHVPAPVPTPEEAPPEAQRVGFGRMLLVRLKEATGFSFVW